MVQARDAVLMVQDEIPENYARNIEVWAVNVSNCVEDEYGKIESRSAEDFRAAAGSWRWLWRLSHADGRTPRGIPTCAARGLYSYYYLLAYHLSVGYCASIANKNEPYSSPSAAICSPATNVEN